MRTSPLKLICLMIIAFAALYSAPAAHAAATISIDRDPAPPQAVINNGTGQVFYEIDISYTSAPRSYEVQVFHDVNNNGLLDGPEAYVPACAVNTNGVTGNLVAQPSPVTRTGSCTIPNGAAAGVYRIVAIYRTSDDINGIPNGPAGDVEQEASVNFLVQNATGNLRIQKFEDLNGNGLRDAGEPGVAGWPFSVTSPTISGVGTITNNYSTAADGSITLNSLVLGTYTVSEGSQPGWGAISATTQSTQVVANQTSQLVFANARLADVCGVAYLDENKNGVRDANEPTRFANVTITLSNGQTAPTNGNGGYCFTNLLPGQFALDSGLPAGPYYACGDVDGPFNGKSHIGPFSLTSGQQLRDQDFGFCELPAQLAIKKSVNRAVVRQGGVVIWTITVRSTGPVTARNVVLTDPLIKNSTIVSTGGGKYRAGKITWNLGDMAPGTSKTVRFTTKFDKDARTITYVNTATAKGENTLAVKASAKTRVIKAPRRIIQPVVTG